MELSEVKKYLENYSAVRKKMDVGRNYYKGIHDILKKKRLAIGENGELVELTNLPNLRFVDNQYARLADQKKNYILSLPPTIKSSDPVYQKLIEDIFNLRFLRTLNKIALDVFNCGIGWLYVYMDKGEFKYKKLNPKEITPVWEDEEREKLKAVIREYVTGNMKHLDVYTEEGVYRYSAELRLWTINLLSGQGIYRTIMRCFHTVRYLLFILRLIMMMVFYLTRLNLCRTV